MINASMSVFALVGRQLLWTSLAVGAEAHMQHSTALIVSVLRDYNVVPFMFLIAQVAGGCSCILWRLYLLDQSVIFTLCCVVGLQMCGLSSPLLWHHGGRFCPLVGRSQCPCVEI